MSSSYKIEINELNIRTIDPDHLYTIPEASQILRMSRQTIKARIAKKRLIPCPHRKHEHYKIFGSELRRFLKYSNDYLIEKYG